MPAPYDYSSSSGYARVCPDWADFPATTTPIQQTHLDRLDQAVYDLKVEKRNVRDFGATADGTTDDTTAIAAALTDTGWPTNRAALFFPPGRYRHNGTLTLDGGGALSTPPIDVYGYGAELYTETTSANPIVSVTNSVVSLTFANFYGLQFQPNVSSGRTAVKLHNTSHSKFVNCVFGGSFDLGVHITGTSSYNRLLGCEFDNMARGIYLDGVASHTHIVGCSFTEQLVGSPLNWIESDSGAALVSITGCVFYGTGATLPIIRIYDGSFWTISGCTFAACEQEAIHISTDGSSYGHSIVGNTFYGGSRHDIIINGGRRNTIMGNVFGQRAGGVAADTFANVRILNTFGGNAGKDNIVVGNNSLDTASAITNIVQADAGSTNLIVHGNLGDAGTSYTAPTVASAATVTLPFGIPEVIISGTTTVTSLTAAGYAGQTVTLIFSGILTFTDGSNLKLSANFVTSADDTITLWCDGTNWFEKGRSAN